MENTNDILNLASKPTYVSVPFDTFRDSIVEYQILSNRKNRIMKNYFIVKPQNNNKNQYLILGYSYFKKEILPITINQLNFVLGLLSDYLRIFPDEDSFNLKDIKITKSVLREIIKEDIRENTFLKITDKFNALIGSNLAEERCKVLLQFNDYNIAPSNLTIINSNSSLDYAELNFEKKDISYKELKSFHLLESVKLNLIIGSEQEYSYKASCLEYKKENNRIQMVLSNDIMFNMNKTRSKFFYVEKYDAREIFYFISRKTGIEKNKLHIQDFNKLPENIYIIVIPVENLIIKKSLGIGDVTFCSSKKNTSFEIEKMNTKLEEQNISLNYYTCAKIPIENSNSYDAYIEGKEKISQALNLLLHIVRSDTLFMNYSLDNNFTNWNRENLIPRPKLLPWVSIYNTNSRGLIITNIEKITEPINLRINEKIIKKINNAEWCETLLNKYHDIKSKELKPLFNALKWLKKSWDSENMEDQIIFSVIALEFVIAGESASPLIPTKCRKKIVKSAINTFKKECEKNEDQLENTLNQKLNQSITNPPLFAKLKSLIDRINIPVKEKDIKRLRQIRSIRNDIVHGRGYKNITKQEILEANQIIGILIAHKLHEKKR